MNTHIIIPIVLWKKVYLEAKSEEAYELLHSLENGSKKISLDEKNIEKKAIEAYPSTGERDSGERKAYKQALKDLI